jgi:ankyrin repeat protein
MKTTIIALLSIGVVMLAASVATPRVSQNAASWRVGTDYPAAGKTTEFQVVGNAKFLMKQAHARSIAVLVQPEAFTIQNLNLVFLRLADEYPAEDFLVIDALTNESQVELARAWFETIRSYSFGNVVPFVGGCGTSPPGPLSAVYSRHDLSERFVYYSTAIEEPISVELQHSSNGCAPTADTATDLVNASRRGCEEVVQELLEGGANPNLKSKHGGAALVEAAFWGSGHLEIVRLLLDAGADINQMSSSGWTPLIAAAALSNRSNLVELLLSRGAAVNLKSQEGRTALVYAVRLGDKNVVKKLLAHGADVNVEDGYGKTALMIAEEEHYEKLIRVLRKFGATR